MTILGVLLTLALHETGLAESLRAFSLNQAQRLLRAGQEPPRCVNEFGGIVKPVAVVYDSASGDVIIVGHVGEAGTLRLNDFVVALRAILSCKQTPIVSIDRRPDTERTGKQTVYFGGDIAQTAFGKMMLEADVALKKLGLGTLKAEVWGVRSYFDMSADDWRATGRERPLVCRFWFRPLKSQSFVTVREGVAVVGGLRIAVETQTMTSAPSANAQRGSADQQDEIGQAFAASLNTGLEDLTGHIPEIGRLEPLFALTGLAEGIRRWQEKHHLDLPCLQFWLTDYRIERIETPEDFPVISSVAKRESNGGQRSMTIEGGVELSALVLDLADGSPTAFRDVVIKSRTSPDSLTWDVPLPDNWAGSLGSVAATALETKLRQTPAFRTLGMSLLRQYGSPDTPLAPPPMSLQSVSLASPPTSISAFDFRSSLPREPFARNIGGVMLQGTAAIQGAQRAEVSLTNGHFSLVVDGRDARIAPEAYRKFVTALWCVYYSPQDPGVSIDPIGQGVDKHLVRYIGRVINTDLGRVMREADYVMKKWAVGTERPDFPGFRCVDAHWAAAGLKCLGASRRFWFVPEDLTFRRGGDLLLFDSGRMRLKTEYTVAGMRGQTNPADTEFAAFFTKHYQGIAAKYPIYKELFEYAQLVSLARYLKDQGVPLHWFLMAHKDLVLTEDSPGTVAELAKGSDFFPNVTIKGGVDLKSEGTYVYDEAAVAAIRKAIAQRPASLPSTSPEAPSRPTVRSTGEPLSFDLGRQSYSVLPQHSLSSGNDSRGIRYQTDLALRQNGMPGLELVRCYDPRRREDADFGLGWRLLIPYRVQPADDARREFLNARIPQRMVVENLLTGHREVLTFSPDRYAAAGYVPERPEASPTIGLFLMSNASFRLADKLGNQFHFDPGGRLTSMFLSADPKRRVTVEYVDTFTGAFARSPYRLEPQGDTRVPFQNGQVPKQFKVTDPLHGCSELLTFEDRRDIPGYVPEREQPSRFRLLALLRDGGYLLVDKHGNRIRFNSTGKFESLLPVGQRRLVSSLSMCGQKATFGYTIAPDGHVIIATTSLAEDKPFASPTHIVRYEYDAEGRLGRVDRTTSGIAQRPTVLHDAVAVHHQSRRLDYSSP
jgi:hypothetical protein